MTLALDGTALGTVHNGTLVSAVLTTQNNFDVIIAFFYYEAASVSAATVSGGGLTWTKRQEGPAGNSLSIEEWWAPAPATLSAATVFADIGSASTNMVLQVFGVSGVPDYTSPFDTNASLPGTKNATSTLPVATISTTAENTFIFAGAKLVSNATQSATAGSGFTLIGDYLQGSPSQATEYQIVSTVQSNLAVEIFLEASVGWGIIVDALAVTPSATGEGLFHASASVSAAQVTTGEGRFRGTHQIIFGKLVGVPTVSSVSAVSVTNGTVTSLAGLASGGIVELNTPMYNPLVDKFSATAKYVASQVETGEGHYSDSVVVVEQVFLYGEGTEHSSVTTQSHQFITGEGALSGSATAVSTQFFVGEGLEQSSIAYTNPTQAAFPVSRFQSSAALIAWPVITLPIRTQQFVQTSGTKMVGLVGGHSLIVAETVQDAFYGRISRVLASGFGLGEGQWHGTVSTKTPHQFLGGEGLFHVASISAVSSGKAAGEGTEHASAVVVSHQSKTGEGRFSSSLSLSLAQHASGSGQFKGKVVVLRATGAGGFAAGITVYSYSPAALYMVTGMQEEGGVSYPPEHVAPSIWDSTE